jgi:aerobic carbon-monoxide dehydrogenase large subunit
MTHSLMSEENIPFLAGKARVEDSRLLRGHGQYLRDIPTGSDWLYGVFVRSSHAHASLAHCNWRDAQAAKGVVKILTYADCAQCVMPPSNPLVPPLQAHSFSILAAKTVTYVGQPIALVIATSAEFAQAAADLAVIDYAPLAPTNDLMASVDPMFRVFYQSDLQQPSSQPPEPKSYPADAIKVQLSHVQPRLISMSLEPRAARAYWNEAEQHLTVWLPTQSTARARDDIAQLLNLTKNQVRVVAPDVGGAFGAKGTVYPEDVAVAFAAKQMSVGIHWAGTRSEEFVSAAHGRGGHLNGALTLSANGEFLHLDARLKFPLGAWLPFSAGMPLRNAARILPGPYRVAAMDIEATGYLSNAAPMNIYRGAGRPEAALLMERLVDRAAFNIGFDPVELRRKNLIPNRLMPYKTGTGEILDSGDYSIALNRACEVFGYEDERLLQGQRRGNGDFVGIGVAMYVEPCGQGWESARVTLHSDIHGALRAEVASGSVAQGQGHETSYAVIASEALGIAFQSIRVVHGDTACCPDGVGALASRSMAIGGSAVLEACREVIGKHAAGALFPIVAEVKYTVTGETWSYGCVMARMSIDSETGKPLIEKIVWVDDAGKIITPQLAHGQLLGGAAQGIGQAMMERIVYDENGQLLTGSLMDYAVPRASDMPPIHIQSLTTVSPSNSLGAKGVGEAGCIGIPAALLNAASDALSPYFKKDEWPELAFPLTSEQLWRVIENCRTTMNESLK